MDKEVDPPRDVSSLDELSVSPGGGEPYEPPGEIAFSGGEPSRTPRYRLVHWLLGLIAFAAYAGFVVPQWGEGYIDFGDGNYMYIASRIAEGAVVYRDILAPQPPNHLFLGAGLVKLHEALNASIPATLQRDHPILFFRAFSLLLQFATFLLVIRLGGRAWGSAAAGIAAGAVYLALPLNLWWGMAYQSEPLEIFFLLAMMNCALGGRSAGDFFAGVFAAMAAMTNATAAPFLLVLILYMAVANWRRALRMAVPALVLAGAMTGLMEWYSGGYFLRTVVLDQAGTVPPDDTLNYMLGKIEREGGDILFREGVFIIVGLLGLFRFIRTSPLQAEARGGLVWFSLATLGSFLYVIKGGTVDYIFSLAGPALAIMGGALWAEVAPLGDEDENGPGHAAPAHWLRWIDSALPRLVALALLALVLFPVLMFYQALWTQEAWELPDLDHAPKLADGSPGPNVEQIEFWIEQYSEPGDTILAPPFYAVLTGRDLWGDYSELFIWRIKDHNDRMADDLEGRGYQKTLALAGALGKAELPIAIVEMDQTGQLPEVREALDEAYRPLLEEPYRTLNTRLGIFVPRGEGGPDSAPVPPAQAPAGAPRAPEAEPGEAAPTESPAPEAEAPASPAPARAADAPTTPPSPAANVETETEAGPEETPRVVLFAPVDEDEMTTTPAPGAPGSDDRPATESVAPTVMESGDGMTTPSVGGSSPI